MHSRDYKEVVRGTGAGFAGFERVLCVRADNMGDIIMSTPAFRALKTTFNSHITLLTSSMGKPITPFIREIDEVIVHDFPWVKIPGQPGSGSGTYDGPGTYGGPVAHDGPVAADGLYDLVAQIKNGRFDAAVIFTVYSQNPLPTALLLYMAGVPRRLAYCRENPYGLLTDWVPDEEPYYRILHQVERDLQLVRHWGAKSAGDDLHLYITDSHRQQMQEKVRALGVDTRSGWVVLHPGVSDARRKYPLDDWIAVSRLLQDEQGLQVIISGAGTDRDTAGLIAAEGGDRCFNAAGRLNVGEWIALIEKAFLLVSVNTAAVHIGAAVNTPEVVLYAMTNPQHTPWKTPSVVLPFSVREDLKSKNQVIAYVNKDWDPEPIPYPTALRIAEAAEELLTIYTSKSKNHFFMEKTIKYALVTGGSTGIGYELAKLLAADGYTLILVARDNGELDRAAGLISTQSGVKVMTIAKDLFEPKNAFDLVEEISSQGIIIDVLVNDAGQGLYGEFKDTDINRELDIINLNIAATVILTKGFLKNMVDRGEGKILNLASIAGKTPGPLQSVYHGTKAFIHSFTEAIRSEVKDSGVTVTSLLPGATDTDFFNKADMLDAKNVKEGELADPAKVAKDGYDALMNNEDMVVSGTKNKIQVGLSNVLPDSVVADQVHKQQSPVGSRKD